MMEAMYHLLRELGQASESRSPLTAMEQISKAIRNHLDAAWGEYGGIEDQLYDLRKEIEELQYMLTLAVHANEDIALKEYERIGGS